MRRTVRSAIGLALAAATTVTTVGTAYADPGTRADDTAQATTGLLTEIAGTEAALGGLGLSLLDFADAEPKSPEFLDELARLLDDWEPGTGAAPDPSPDCEVHLLDGSIVPCTDDAVPAGAARATAATSRAASDAQRLDLAARWLAHAYATAEVNSARDRNARDIGTETTYMYLSHYVDLPQDPTQYPVDYNSYANRYAAWITQDDRRVFDQYLRYDRHVETAYQIARLGEALRDLTSVPGSVAAALQAVGTWGGSLRTAAAALDGTDSVGAIGDSIGALIDIWNAGDDPEAMIRTIEQGLASEVDLSAPSAWEVLTTLLSGAAMVAAGPAGVVAGVAAATLTLSIQGMKDVVDQAMLAGLLATATSRVTLRYLRSIGMD